MDSNDEFIFQSQGDGSPPSFWHEPCDTKLLDHVLNVAEAESAKLTHTCEYTSPVGRFSLERRVSRIEKVMGRFAARLDLIDAPNFTMLECIELLKLVRLELEGDNA